MIWDLDLLARVSSLRVPLRVVLGASADMPAFAASRVDAAARQRFGVRIDGRDILYDRTSSLAEEGVFGEARFVARWAPQVRDVEAVGGPVDGGRFVRVDLNEPFHAVGASSVIELVHNSEAESKLDDLVRWKYELSGWNPQKRVWIFTGGRA